MLPPGPDYDEIHRAFRWQIPAEFNIGVEVCDRWADREHGKLAIVAVGADGKAHDVSYGWLRDTSNKLANALAANGIAPAATQAFTLNVITLLPPTLDPIADPAPILENAGLQTVNLSGITAGGSETQPLQVTATSDTPSLTSAT